MGVWAVCLGPATAAADAPFAATLTAGTDGAQALLGQQLGLGQRARCRSRGEGRPATVRSRSARPRCWLWPAGWGLGQAKRRQGRGRTGSARSSRPTELWSCRTEGSAGRGDSQHSRWPCTRPVRTDGLTRSVAEAETDRSFPSLAAPRRPVPAGAVAPSAIIRPSRRERLQSTRRRRPRTGTGRGTTTTAIARVASRPRGTVRASESATLVESATSEIATTAGIATTTASVRAAGIVTSAGIATTARRLRSSASGGRRQASLNATRSGPGGRRAWPKRLSSENGSGR